MELMEKLVEPAKTLSNPYVEGWREKGGKVIGYSGTYTPEEIIYAAGILPYRIGGREATKVTIADMYFGPVICNFVKCVLENAADGRFDFLDGAIITYECDHMRRIFDAWRRAAKDGNARLPAFFQYYGLPHSRSEHATKLLMAETQRLIKELEKHFGVEVTEEGLRNAIKVYNKTRQLLRKLYELREKDEVPVTGTEALGIVITSTVMPKDEYNKQLEKLLDELGKRKGITGRPRLMIVGSVNDDIELVKLMEDLGAVVVADSLCYGARCFWNLVEENGDPLQAIVTRYWEHIPCPRMYGEYSRRYSFVRDIARSGKVDGVILENIRFCDLHGIDNTLYGRDLEAEGIPTLRLERQYGPLADSGRLRTRVQAFLERIGG